MINISYPDLFSSALFYTSLVGENEPHISVLVAFVEPDGIKLGGENSLDFRAFGGQ